MQYIKTAIPDVFILEPKVYADSRGYFMESFVQRDFDANIRPVRFIQDNESSSSYGVLRGLHFQKGRQSQSKLIRVVSGRVVDVAVDLRVGSPTYARHVSVELSGQNHRMFFIPRGFAHGFVVLSPKAVFQYKCDNYYAPEAEGAVAWNDPELDIPWPVPAADLILSPKDAAAPFLKDCTEADLFRYSDPLY